MGTERRDYIMLGAKLPYEAIDANEQELLDAYWDNAYEDEVKEHGGITMVADGMNGHYVILGKVLMKGLEDGGFEMTEVLAPDLNMVQLIAARVQDILKLDEPPEVKTWVFSHYH